jgi:hypothetical protein
MVRKTADLWTERRALANNMRTATSTDVQLFTVQAFLAGIRAGQEKADFNAKRQSTELLDPRGKLALEAGEKVICLKCLIDLLEQQPRLHMPVLPSSNSRDVNTISPTRRAVIAGPPV